MVILIKRILRIGIDNIEFIICKKLLTLITRKMILNKKS